jgi:hypothetical protein
MPLSAPLNTTLFKFTSVSSTFLRQGLLLIMNGLGDAVDVKELKGFDIRIFVALMTEGLVVHHECQSLIPSFSTLSFQLHDNTCLDQLPCFSNLI